MPDRLWVCHDCKMIGDEAEAGVHEFARGHAVERLSEEVTNGIREEWDALQAQRVAGLRSLAALVARVRGSRDTTREDGP